MTEEQARERALDWLRLKGLEKMGERMEIAAFGPANWLVTFPPQQIEEIEVGGLRLFVNEVEVRSVPTNRPLGWPQ